MKFRRAIDPIEVYPKTVEAAATEVSAEDRLNLPVRLSDQDWAELRQQAIDDVNSLTSRMDQSLPLAYQALLFKEAGRFEMFNEEERMKTRCIMEALLEDRAFSEYLHIAAALVIAQAEQRENVVLPDEVFDEHLVSLFEHSAFEQWELFLDEALRMYLVYPNERRHLNLEPQDNLDDQDIFAIMKRIITSLRDVSIEAYVSQVTRLFLLYPERRGELGINNDLIEEMNDKLKELYEEKQWKRFANLAAQILLLRAESVEVTENGIELIAPENVGDFRIDDVPELPGRQLVS